MWSDGVAMLPPLFDDDFGMSPVSEPLHVQAFVTQLAIEGFVHTILPWLARINVGGFDVLFS